MVQYGNICDDFRLSYSLKCCAIPLYGELMSNTILHFAGGFMGDIALPNINYENEWQRQKLNKTFQQELEQLKQEVYHEGLQVEEEGLTDIIRKKTKLPDPDTSIQEHSKNDAVLLVNSVEMMKTISFCSNLQFRFVDKEPSQSKNVPVPDHTTMPSNNSVTENNGTTPVNRHAEIIMENKENRTEPIEIKATEAEDKPSKNVTEVFRHIDEKKIQSDTKDIEDESGNILQTRRVQIATSTIAPSRSTLPNTFSDAGGNGGTLENVQTLGSDTVIRRRHRRRRHQGRCVHTFCVIIIIVRASIGKT